MNESAAREASSAEPSTRRALLRDVGAGIGAVGVAGLAGCTGSSDSTDVVLSVSKRIDADTTPLSKEEFDAYADETHDRYGDAGPWGERGTEPDHGLSYVGAWTERSRSPTTDSDAVSADHLVALYRVPPEKSRGTSDYYQFWLWSGVEPGGATTVERLQPTVELSGEDRRMRMYAPAEEFTSGPISVGLDRPTVDGLRATVPLPTGTVRVAPEVTRVGGAGAYSPVWSGETTTTQSVTATFESSWPTAKRREFDWRVEIRGETDGA